MPVRDFYLLSTEISLVGIALMVILLDLVVNTKEELSQAWSELHEDTQAIAKLAMLI